MHLVERSSHSKDRTNSHVAHPTPRRRLSERQRSGDGSADLACRQGGVPGGGAARRRAAQLDRGVRLQRACEAADAAARCRRPARRRAVRRGRGRLRRAERALRAADRPARAVAAGRVLPARVAAARSGAGGGGLGPRRLSLRPLQGSARLGAAAVAHPRWRRPRRPDEHDRGGLAGPRSHQHAGLRPGPRRARGGGTRSCRAPRRERHRDRGRRAARQKLPADPCRRPREPARAAADRPHLGPRRRARRSPSSARASASTPAASTSSRRAACC